MTNSGTEACMSAIRLARGFTKRDKIIKFDGCYHGHGRFAARQGRQRLAHVRATPTAPGVPADFAKLTIVLPTTTRRRSRPRSPRTEMKSRASIRRAGAGQRGFVSAQAGLPGIPARDYENQRRGAGLRRSDDGFSARAGRRAGTLRHHADLSCFGKIIGGGLPVGAFGGRADIMGLPCAARPGVSGGHIERQSAGDGGGDCGARRTRGNPHPGPLRSDGRGRIIGSRRTCWSPHDNRPTVRKLFPSPIGWERGPGVRASVYTRLEQTRLTTGGRHEGRRQVAGVPVTFNRCGSMFCGYFTSEPVWNVADAMKADRERFKKILPRFCSTPGSIWPHRNSRPVSCPPRTAKADIQKTVDAAAKVMRQI